MADRYWVGGTGTWDNASTTNWSATSGGGGGASAPTSADNVFFNTLSNVTAYTVTVGTGATCADMTMAGPATGNVTWAGNTALTIAGSATIAATGVTRTYTGTITFSATTAGKTITIGVGLGSNVTFNGVGGGWTLGSALSLPNATINCTNGSFDTSAVGNYAVSCNNFTASSASAFVLNFNASTITAGGNAFNMTGSGLTFNAGTSQINFTSVLNITFSGSRTYHNVSFLGTPGTAFTNIGITGSNVFNNLSFQPPASSAIQLFVNLSANQTINGTLTGSGGSVVRRIFYNSNTLGTARTITLASATTLSNVDFRDITAATNAITATTGGGNCGGNTNITFPAAKTVYWNLAGSQNWSATGWAASSGGSPALSNFPLAQDTAVFDNAGAAGTVTISNDWSVGTVDMSTRTSAVTIAISSGNSFLVYGDWLNGSGTTLSATGLVVFTGRGNTQLLSGNGRDFTQSMLLQNIGGTLRLTSAVSLGSARTFTLTNGTLDLQSFTLTTGLFSSFNANVRTIAFGTGNITVNGTGTIWTTNTATNLTTTGTQVVNVSNATATASSVLTGFMTEANSISFNFTTGTYALTLGSTSKRSMNFTGFAGTVSNATQAIYGDLNLGSTATFTAGGNTWTFASTSATPRTITSNSKTMDFPVTFDGVGGTWVLQDALTMGSTQILRHTNGTINLNGMTLTCGAEYRTNTGTKNLTFNGGTLVCPAAGSSAFNNPSAAGFTTTAGTGTGTISMTSASGKSFSGGGATYNCTINQGGAGALTIVGANTFNNITNTVQPASVLFLAGVTNTFNNFNLNGTAGNLITIASTTASTHTLSKASGTVSVDYLSITNSTATGGATWYAGANSTNGGGNSGWIFTAPPSSGYTITAVNGTYLVSGQNATLSFGRLLSAQNGVYSVAGQAVDISVGAPPAPTLGIELFVEIRSFTERRRF